MFHSQKLSTTWAFPVDNRKLEPYDNIYKIKKFTLKFYLLTPVDNSVNNFFFIFMKFYLYIIQYIIRNKIYINYQKSYIGLLDFIDLFAINLPKLVFATKYINLLRGLGINTDLFVFFKLSSTTLSALCHKNFGNLLCLKV